jgi:hypothetical protein
MEESMETKSEARQLVDGSARIDQMRHEVMTVVNLITGWVNSLQVWEWPKIDEVKIGPSNNLWTIARLPEDTYRIGVRKPSEKLKCFVSFIHTTNPDGCGRVTGFDNFTVDQPGYWIVQDMHESLDELVTEMFKRHPKFKLWCKPFLRVGL